MSYGTIGTISEGTMRPEDLIPAFAGELKSLDTEGEYTSLIAEAEKITDWESDNVNYILEELFDALDSFSPPYCYFGSHPGDGSDCGFWPLLDAAEEAVQEGDVLKVNDLEEIPNDYTGEVLAVTDHGNATLYGVVSGEVKQEYWAIV